MFSPVCTSVLPRIFMFPASGSQLLPSGCFVIPFGCFAAPSELFAASSGCFVIPFGCFAAPFELFAASSGRFVSPSAMSHILYRMPFPQQMSSYEPAAAGDFMESLCFELSNHSRRHNIIPPVIVKGSDVCAFAVRKRKNRLLQLVNFGNLSRQIFF